MERSVFSSSAAALSKRSTACGNQAGRRSFTPLALRGAKCEIQSAATLSRLPASIGTVDSISKRTAAVFPVRCAEPSSERRDFSHQKVRRRANFQKQARENRHTARSKCRPVRAHRNVLLREKPESHRPRAVEHQFPVHHDNSRFLPPNTQSPIVQRHAVHLVECRVISKSFQQVLFHQTAMCLLSERAMFSSRQGLECAFTI